LQALTLTSDNFVDSTVLMLTSLRVWHPDLPVVVYALDTGWTDEHAAKLAKLDVELRLIEEADPRHRGGADGRAIQNVHKMDIFLAQQQPYLFLDSDILVLRPLHELFERIETDGWATVREGTPLVAYWQGDITDVVELDEIPQGTPSINTGVLGCNPSKHRALFELAASWIPRISGIRSGDQGLINVAWFKKHGRIPETVGNKYNGGWLADDSIRLTNSIIHFARPNYPPPGRSKHDDQQRVWDAWPCGVELTNLTDTAFWRDSQPHPWPWTNQCNRKAYRDEVKRVRAASRDLGNPAGVVIEDAYQAYLLDAELLQSIRSWWAANAEKFEGLRVAPTYCLTTHGVPPALPQRLQRLRLAVMSRLR